MVTNCNQLKMRSPKDGKRYNTDEFGKGFDVSNLRNMERLNRKRAHKVVVKSLCSQSSD